MKSRPAAAAFALLASLALPALSRAQVVVPYANRTTVDTDGDSVPNVSDNAPGISNNQADEDADAIGDVVDPTPSLSNPYLGDPGLVLGGPYTITAGSHAFIDYLMVTTPPGAFGHIDLDFGGDGTYDATYFGPLTSSLNAIDIPPSLYAGASWDLNANGTYVVHAKAYAPGMWSASDSVTVVNVVPEPAALSLLALVPLAGRRGRNCR